MYLSNRLPIANYDLKGRKNQTVKISKTIINSKHTRSIVQEAAARIQRNSADTSSVEDVPINKVSTKQLKSHNPKQIDGVYNRSINEDGNSL